MLFQHHYLIVCVIFSLTGQKCHCFINISQAFVVIFITDNDYIRQFVYGGGYICMKRFYALIVNLLKAQTIRLSYLVQIPEATAPLPVVLKQT